MAVLSKYTSLPLAEAVKIQFGIRYYRPRHRRSRKSRVAAPHRTVLSQRRRRPYGSAQKAQVGDGMSRRRDIKRAAPMVHLGARPLQRSRPSHVQAGTFSKFGPVVVRNSKRAMSPRE